MKSLKYFTIVVFMFYVNSPFAASGAVDDLEELMPRISVLAKKFEINCGEYDDHARGQDLKSLGKSFARFSKEERADFLTFCETSPLFKGVSGARNFIDVGMNSGVNLVDQMSYLFPLEEIRKIGEEVLSLTKKLQPDKQDDLYERECLLQKVKQSRGWKFDSRLDKWTQITAI